MDGANVSQSRLLLIFEVSDGANEMGSVVPFVSQESMRSVRHSPARSSNARASTMLSEHSVEGICIPRGSNARAVPSVEGICIPRSSNACAAPVVVPHVVPVVEFKPVVVPAVDFRSERSESFDVVTCGTSELDRWLLHGGNLVR